MNTEKHARLISIISRLKRTPGLSVIEIVSENHKNLIKNAEVKNNEGVFECLNRQYTLLLSHDSSFRPPAGEIVNITNSTISFPPVQFPEANAENVISSSPSSTVHEALLKSLNLTLDKEEATLLLGFDLE